MIRSKAWISIGVFLILFVGAWLVYDDHTELNRMIPQEHQHDDVNLYQLDEEPTFHPSSQYRGEPFRPREYIRIYPRQQ